MRVLDPANLVPWKPVEFTKDEVEHHLAQFRRGLHQAATSDMGGRKSLIYLARLARQRGDSVWLQDNVPVGTGFGYFGSAAIVMGHLAPRRLTDKWKALVHYASQGGPAEREFTVNELRALLEPGFVVIPEEFPLEGAPIIVDE